MIAQGQPIPAGLRTIEIRVPGANCPWCLNEAIDRLRDLDGVAEVRASILDEHIEVKHRDVPTALLLDTLRTYLHGSDNSSHECQMVAVEPEPVPLGRAGPSVEETRSMETLLEAMGRLRSLGYVADFVASPEGNLLSHSCGTSHAPESIQIRETVRFEGDSNPEDEAILFAMACADGCLGQYSAAFGPGTPPADVIVLQRLATPQITEPRRPR